MLRLAEQLAVSAKLIALRAEIESFGNARHPSLVRKFTNWLIVLAFGAATITLAFAITRSREPQYQGRSLSEWLSVFTQPAFPADGFQASEAVRHIGAQAIPFLLSDLTPTPNASKLRRFLISCIDKLPGRTVPRSIRDWLENDHVAERQEQAMRGFHILGKTATPAIPKLFRLATNRLDEDLARKATYALGGVGLPAFPQLLQILTNTQALARSQAILSIAECASNDVTAASAIIGCLKDPARDVTYVAAEALGRMRIPAEIATPALAGALKAENPMTRWAAAGSLRLLGKAAVPAVGNLQETLVDETAYVRRAATNALREIAPELLTNTPAH